MSFSRKIRESDPSDQLILTESACFGSDFNFEFGIIFFFSSLFQIAWTFFFFFKEFRGSISGQLILTMQILIMIAILKLGFLSSTYQVIGIAKFKFGKIWCTCVSSGLNGTSCAWTNFAISNNKILVRVIKLCFCFSFLKKSSC
jgi:hypothetical protein